MARETLDARLEELRDEVSQFRSEHPDAKPVGFVVDPGILPLTLPDIVSNSEYYRYLLLGYYYGLPVEEIAQEFDIVTEKSGKDQQRLLRTIEVTDAIEVLRATGVTFRPPKAT